MNWEQTDPEAIRRLTASMRLAADSAVPSSGDVLATWRRGRLRRLAKVGLTVLGVCLVAGVVTYAAGGPPRKAPVVAPADQASERRIPFVVGLSLSEAERALEASGFVIGTADLRMDAIVVAQEPPEDLLAPIGTIVGVRAAHVTDALCSVLIQLPPVSGDARQLASRSEFSETVAQAVNVATDDLRAEILILNEQLADGQSAATLDGQALDAFAIHHAACLLR